MKDAIDLLLATALVWVETAVGARRPRRPSVLACTLFAKVESAAVRASQLRPPQPQVQDRGLIGAERMKKL